MPENNNENLEKKVRHIVVGEGKFIWGIIVATTLIVGAFMSVRIEIASLAMNISNLTKVIDTHTKLTADEGERIARLEALIGIKK